jgi:hypothetical protein
MTPKDERRQLRHIGRNPARLVSREQALTRQRDL